MRAVSVQREGPIHLDELCARCSVELSCVECNWVAQMARAQQVAALGNGGVQSTFCGPGLHAQQVLRSRPVVLCLHPCSSGSFCLARHAANTQVLRNEMLEFYDRHVPVPSRYRSLKLSMFERKPPQHTKLKG